MSKFTPGKWMVDGNGVSVFDERKEATLFIVDNVWEWEDTEGEADANARLIAHAPEMYGYLVQIINDYDLDSDLEGDIMWMLKEINGGQW